MPPRSKSPSLYVGEMGFFQNQPVPDSLVQGVCLQSGVRETDESHHSFFRAFS
jgi:hypothetical protein